MRKSTFPAAAFVAFLSAICWLVISLKTASAATFAPTAEEISAASAGGLEAMAVVPNQSAPQVDSTGRSYYEVGDMRYAVDVVQLDSGFSGRMWPGGILYYQFDAGVTVIHRQAWRDAAAAWSAVAAVSFVESTGAGNYVRVVSSTTANNSYVGMIGGAQEMNIVNWDYKYIMAH